MPSDPVAAGKKGGQSRSASKLAACKRNGFQRIYPVEPSEEIQDLLTTVVAALDSAFPQ
jgi:hypothetical protein